MLNRFSSFHKYFKKANIFTKNKTIFQSIMKFSTLQTTGGNVVQPPKRTYGGLKDSDRIFTNLYRDGDPFIEGALKRVYHIEDK
jgi:hypothetical protein